MVRPGRTQRRQQGATPEELAAAETQPDALPRAGPGGPAASQQDTYVVVDSIDVTLSGNLK